MGLITGVANADFKSDTAIVHRCISLADDFKFSNTDSSLHYASVALIFAERCGYNRGILMAYNSMGIAYRYMGNYKATLSNYHRAMNLADSIGDKAMLSRIYGNIGVVYYQQDQYKEALTYYKKALVIAEELNDSIEMGPDVLNIANIYTLDKANYEKGVEQFKRAILISKRTSSHNIYMLGCINLAYLYNEMGKSDKAIPLFKEAIGLARQRNNIRYLCQGLLHLSKIYTDRGLTREAENNLEEAAEKIKTLPYKDVELSYLEAKIHLLKAKKLYKEAFEFQEKYIKLNDSLKNTENLETIEQIRSQFEFERKQMENEHLKKEKTVLERLNWTKAKTIRTQTNLSFGLMFGLLVITLLAFLYYRQKQKKNKMNRLLHKQYLQLEALNETIRKINEMQEETIAERTKELTRHIEILERYSFFHSHELRKSIANIIGLVDLLENDEVCKEEVIRMIARAAEEMDSFIKKINAENHYF